MKQEGGKTGRFDDCSEILIGACIEVHRTLGPGLLESAYEECLCHELRELRLPFERQKALPVVYKGIELAQGYRLDLVVNREILLEIKAVERLLPIHDGPSNHVSQAQWTCGWIAGQFSCSDHQARPASPYQKQRTSRLPAFL